MTDVQTETIPPGVDEPGGDGESNLVQVHASISTVDDTHHNAYTMYQAQHATPEAMAEGLLCCALAVAAMHSSDTLFALQQRILRWGTP